MENITSEAREFWCGGVRITLAAYRARQANARKRMDRLRSMGAAPTADELATGAGTSRRWALDVLAGRDPDPKTYTAVLPALEAVILLFEARAFGCEADEVPPLPDEPVGVLEPARESERVS